MVIQRMWKTEYLHLKCGAELRHGFVPKSHSVEVKFVSARSNTKDTFIFKNV
jgi:hypothetical protein